MFITALGLVGYCEGYPNFFTNFFNLDTIAIRGVGL